MENYLITGIQQVGTGIDDRQKSCKWCDDIFQMHVKILKDDVNRCTLENKGFPFMTVCCPDISQFNLGQAPGYCPNIEDSDSIPIEFVETQSIPVIDKLNTEINFMKQDCAAKPYRNFCCNF